MKLRLFFLFLAFSAVLTSRAQNGDTDIDEYRTQFDFLTQQLDFSAATTGLLLQKNGALVSLDDFDGQSTGPSSTADLDQFGWAYATLLGAAIDPTAQLPLPQSVYMDYSRSYYQPAPAGEVVPIAALFQRYNSFYREAQNQGIVELINGQFVPATGVQSSDYIEERTAVLFTPLGVFGEDGWHGRVGLGGVLCGAKLGNWVTGGR